MRSRGYFSSLLDEPRARDGLDATTPSWSVHAVQIFPATQYAFSVGFWWLEPARFGVTGDEIAELSASLGRVGASVDFLRRHFEARHLEATEFEELELTQVGDRVGKRVRSYSGDEYVVVPIRGRGVLVVAGRFDRKGDFERQHVWPRILASVQIGPSAGRDRQAEQTVGIVDDPGLPVVFSAGELHSTAWFASALGTPRTRAGRKSQPRSWELRSPDLPGLSSLGTHVTLEIAFFWLAADGRDVAEAEVESLAAGMSRNGLGLEFMRRHFDGEPAEFRRAKELNLVPIGNRLGQRIAIYDRAEFVVLPVRGRGVLVAAANFAEGGGEYERYRVWPRIVASIRIRDDAELEPPD